VIHICINAAQLKIFQLDGGFYILFNLNNYQAAINHSYFPLYNHICNVVYLYYKRVTATQGGSFQDCLNAHLMMSMPILFASG